VPHFATNVFSLRKLKAGKCGFPESMLFNKSDWQETEYEQNY